MRSGHFFSMYTKIGMLQRRLAMYRAKTTLKFVKHPIFLTVYLKTAKGIGLKRSQHKKKICVVIAAN